MTTYQQNVIKLKAGDVVVFRGAWYRSPLTAMIELFAPNQSHSAIVRNPVTKYSPVDCFVEQSTRPLIVRSGDKDGVQRTSLGSVIAGYPGGTAAGLQLSDASRKRMNLFKFFAWMGACDGHVSYGIDDLFAFLLRDIPVIGTRVAQEQELSSMVCSAFVCSALIRCGVLSGMNWQKCSPQDLVELGIYSGYVPLLGTPKLTRFNTLG